MRDIFKALEDIENTAGTNDKVSKLSRYVDDVSMKMILQCVYSFGIKFYIKKFDCVPAAVQEATFKDFYCLAENLKNRKITGNAAVDAVEKFLGRCDEFHALWYSRIIKKDLRIGMGIDLVNKAGFNVPVFEVALAKDGKKTKKLSDIVSKGVYVSQKLDGYRCVAEIENGEVTLYSRNGNVYENFPSIEKALLSAFPNMDMILDGEIMSDDFESMQRSAFANKRGTTVGDVVYNVFDYVPLDEWRSGQFEMKAGDRYDKLAEIFTNVDDKQLKMVPHMPVDTLEQILELERKYIEMGYEGAMAMPNIPYYRGRCTGKLLKFKTMLSMDCKVVDVMEGNGKYAGMMGSLVVRQENDKLCEVGTGFKDDDRVYIYNNVNSIMGNIVEVKYQELSSDGIMRFPVMMRFRNDK